MQVGTSLCNYAFGNCAAALVIAAVFVIGCDADRDPRKTGTQATGTQATGTQATGTQATGTQAAGELETGTQKIGEVNLGANETQAKAQFGSSQSNSTNEVVGNAAEADTQSTADTDDKVDLSNRTFMTLKPVTSDNPAELAAHIRDVDAALRDLIVAGSSPIQIIGAETFNSCGMRLGQMKLTAGEKLASLPNATDEQRKLGTVAQLVALSHMSGLKDVESAKKLEKFAGTLMQSSDLDLAHQGRVVLLGFRLQDLQNGAVAEPGQLLNDLEGLFLRPADAGFPEMMILQQAETVLTEMGFTEAAVRVNQLVISKYMDSADLQLSEMAWKAAISKSRSFENYFIATQDIYNGKEQEPQMLLGAVRGLYDELPYSITLLQFASLSTDLEFRGLVDVASALTEFIKAKAETLQHSPYISELNSTLRAQNLRLGLRGQSFDIDGMIGFDGKPLDWSTYKGKVVLVDFWASWCEPCKKELPNIQQTHEEFASKGFEVLSINMDDDLDKARNFLTGNRLPWKTYHSSDLTALGFQSAIAKRLGINAIPFIAIIGTDGKVAAVHVRGDRLAPIVRSLLGNGLSN